MYQLQPGDWDQFTNTSFQDFFLEIKYKNYLSGILIFVCNQKYGDVVLLLTHTCGIRILFIEGIHTNFIYHQYNENKDG